MKHRVFITAAKARREPGWVPRHVSLVNEAEDLYHAWVTQQAPVG